MAAVAAIIGLCAIGMKISTIWTVAKTIKSAIDAHNPIRMVQERHLVQAGRLIGYEIELYTANGWEYFFCIDAQDLDMRALVLQHFPVGQNINKAVCDHARAQMAALQINHRFYLDRSHAGGKRVFILMSANSARHLHSFAKPHWQPIV